MLTPVMSCNTEYWAAKEYEVCVFTGAAPLKSRVDLRWSFRRLSMCVLRHVHPISFTCDRVCVWVHRCALMQVCNSETSVVKLQWSTGICEVSCSGFVIPCKTLTDLLRQQKNQNQLGDVTHCLLIFICDSHWLHERYQGIASCRWKTRQSEKSTRQERFGEINGERKGNRRADRQSRRGISLRDDRGDTVSSPKLPV